jgi:hypothetical protein
VATWVLSDQDSNTAPNIETAGDDLKVLTFDKAVEPQLVEERNKRGRLSCAGDQKAKPIDAARNLREKLQRR